MDSHWNCEILTSDLVCITIASNFRDDHILDKITISVTQELTIEMKSKIHNRWISISNIFFYNLDVNNLDYYFCCMRHGTCLHCKYAELNNKTAHFTIFES